MSFENKEIKALFWKQPYANLMLHDKIETRTWKTKYRGLVLICSSLKPYRNIDFEDIIKFDINNILYNEDIKLGYAIAIGELVDCRLMTIEDEKKCYTTYRQGLYCHVYDNVRPILPFKIKGSLGWMNLDVDTKLKIKIK